MPTPTAPAAADAGGADAYLRHPTLHGDTVVFVADDDLWSVSARGGVARRLTAGLSEPSTPCLSPDGRLLAFVGRDEQHPEVYAMAAGGGPARRLTWLGTDTLVRGWTPAGEIVYVTTQGRPFFRDHRAFVLSPQGGTPQPLPYGQVNHLAFGPGERKVIGRNTADPARWKRYRGGTAGALWIDAEGNGAFRRMNELAGNLTSPMWIGDRLWYLSDPEGVGNLYSCLPDGSDVRRHTDHDDFYARHAQTDGRRIVYQCGARLWLFDPASGESHAIAVETPSHRTQAARRFVPAGDNLESFAPHPAGHSLAVVARGQLFDMALWEGAVRRHADGDDARLRRGQWLAGGTSLVAVSDASGEERIVVFTGSPTAAARSLPWDVGHVTQLLAAPAGERIAIANHRNEVFVGDVGSGALHRVDASEHGRSDDLAWSPDGAWLAYTFMTSRRHVAIKLHDVAMQASTLVTAPEFRDYSPAFDPAGKYLYFLSLRTYDPVYDSVQFELSFPRAARPYLIALQAGGRPPFEPEPRGLRGEASDAERVAHPPVAAPPAPVRVDLDGIAGRVAAFPVHENRFGRMVGVAGNKVAWSVQPVLGAHGRGGHKEPAGRLEQFDLATGRTETLAEKVDSFELAADGVTLVYREGKRLRAIAADRKVDDKTESAAADAPPSRKNGRLDLERIRIGIEPRREWRQMLREVWRLQRDQFWSADMSGVDWQAAYRLYAPLVERVATRADLSDLIWEMQGELGTSHAYEMGGDHRKPPALALGYLACELRYDAADDSYEITRIVSGDPWDAAADSPLNAVGVEARVGERIVAVGGRRVSRALRPEALLVHQSAAKVQLTLKAGPASDALLREVTVTTLADEIPARYREWVERNRAWVHERSQGRVGYFHLPDMMAAGFAEFHRYFGAECDRDALVVDLRYNRGGHVSELLLEKIARRRIGYAHSRWTKTGSYPDESAAGPVVALTNEHAGSDGDIFSHGFKMMKIGPLVGTRTWGGVVGIWPRHTLVDGTQTTQPEFAFWFNDVGWDIENHGTDPDIEVDNAPQDHVTGNDRQLEVAVATALVLADGAGFGTPAFGPRPRLARQPLPKRQRG
ncbi:MAG: S41 family peptidase [Caldimonas sp.]